MAELDDVTLDGKPLHSLRVADLKTALEQRGLAKSGQKNALIKRLKGALMLENLQRSSAYQSGRQPNSQMGEEMSQNSFIKQYLAKQQELLRQRLEREAREATEADESQKSCEEPEEDEDTATNEDSSFLSDKHHIMHSRLSVRGLPHDPGLTGSQNLDPGPAHISQDSSDAKAERIWHPSFPSGHEEIPTSSPPRAVASLSVRVVGQPERQGLPMMMPRTQEKEGTAPVEAGPTHSLLNLSRSAKPAAGTQADSEEEDEEDDSDDDEDEWGPSSCVKKNVPHPAPSLPAAIPQRSRRKLQPPQHIPPQPQAVHQPPLQLRQPTPPPSPPPELSFPLPDTPKQSPHELDEAAPALPSLDRQESSSSSRSSSPEPPSTRRPGPLSLLVRKMESEGVFRGPPKVVGEVKGEMEVEEQASAKQLHLLNPMVSPTQSSKKEREGLKRNEKKDKVDETSLSTLSSRRIFSQVPPPESLQVSFISSVHNHSEDVPVESKASTNTDSKHKEDRELKLLKKQAAEEQGEESKGVLKSSHISTEEEKNQASMRKATPTKRSRSTSSSSDEDSESSSSQSSSSPSHDKSRRNSQKKDIEEKRRKNVEEEGKRQSSREVKQEALSASASQAAMELEGLSNSESAVDQSDHQEADSSNSHPEENTAAKSFASRKISLNSKTEVASSESEPAGAASRKRRWGSSSAVTAKKPSISITTESLKTLIPEIKPLQEAVVELHPDESRLSVDEDSSGPHEREEPEEDQGLKIRRTVTQIVPSDGRENGQKEMEEDEEAQEDVEEEQQTPKVIEKEKQSKQESSPEASMDVQEGDSLKVTPNDSLVRRSISQQKSGVSITIDDPIRTSRQLSPPRGKTSKIIHVCNLVRPFTLGQLKLLLNQTGTVIEEGFWIDKIKSHCYVTYSTTEEAVATREALHGVKWPASNPKVLRVDFCEQDELDFHKGLIIGDRAGDIQEPQASAAPRRPAPHPPQPPVNHEKEKERGGGVPTVRDQWAERERAMARRERTRSEREWDRDKVKDFGRDERDRTRRSRSRERRHRERGKSTEKRSEKKDKPDEPQVKLLDDLFQKTKAAPCIYWLPLTEEQALQRAQERTQRILEREKKRKAIQEEEDKKREERKDRPKGKDEVEGKSAAMPKIGAARRSPERDKDKDRERERGREADSRKETNRDRTGNSRPTGGSRRSPSHSSASRDRRR